MKKFIPQIKAIITAVVLLGIVYVGSSLYLYGGLSPKAPEIVEVIDPNMVIEPESTEPFDIATFVADATKGAKIANKCKACHVFKNNGKNATGPNLFGVVGRKIAHIASFNYSDAFNERKDKFVWNEDNLYKYLENPKDYIPNNKMAFAGLKKEADRLNVIAWLETLKEE